MDDLTQLRYSRHLLLDEFDFDKQEKLATAKVLLVGVGGLGCPAALYLAAAGVGNLFLADGDDVDFTNLQRQILHNEASVGKLKVQSAAEAIKLINSNCQTNLIAKRLTASEIDQYVSSVDVVLDCSDNFTTRQAINLACVRHSKPLVSGAATRFAGQLAIFDRRQSLAPCYNCLFPESANTNEDQDQCATLGVFAPLTGVIGTLQAAETIKIICNLSTNSNQYLLLYDALDNDWRKISVYQDRQCSVCAVK